jgi:hypothetical protein
VGRTSLAQTLYRRRLYKVIESQCPQNVSTEKVEREQNVATEPAQNVPTERVEWQQNVSTKWKQNVSTQDRDNNTENKETEKTSGENQTTWEKTLERLKEALPLAEAEAWLTGTTLLQVTETAACISVPSTSVLLWLERRMYGQISSAMKGVLGKDLDLQFVAAS